MTTLVRRILAPFFGMVVVTIPVAVGTPAGDAHADTLCSIEGFSPRSATVGLDPTAVTFASAVSGCAPGGWSIEGGAYDFFVTDADPQVTFSPNGNGDSAPVDVVVSTYDSANEEASRSFPDSFVVKRATGWDRFNASPEPVTKGARITVEGRLRMVDWEKRTQVGYAGRSIAVEFRTRTGSYRRIKTVLTGSGGSLVTTVTAVGDGYWRLRYGGNTIAGASTMRGDFVDVR